MTYDEFLKEVDLMLLLQQRNRFSTLFVIINDYSISSLLKEKGILRYGLNPISKNICSGIYNINRSGIYWVAQLEDIGSFIVLFLEEDKC